MDLASVRDFFMWCTIINVGLLFLTIAIFGCAGGWVHRMQSRLFPIPKESSDVVIYALLTGYKTLIVLFNLVPYLALVIIG